MSSLLPHLAGDCHCCIWGVGESLSSALLPEKSRVKPKHVRRPAFPQLAARSVEREAGVAWALCPKKRQPPPVSLRECVTQAADLSSPLICFFLFRRGR